jgi:ankyrin repeat protein
MRTWQDYKKTMQPEDELYRAARAGDLDGLRRCLAAGPDAVRRTDHQGYSALTLAAYHGHAGAVRLLLAAGADPDAADASGGTILMGAAFKGHLGIVQTLVEAGATVGAVNPNGQTALGFARMFGRADVAGYLETRLTSGSSA